ncbi:MAG: S8 family serine peptidase, partial [Sphingobacteriaceae bacterium]
MKILLIAFSVLFQALVLQAQTGLDSKGKFFKFPAGITSKDYIPGVILVKFKSEINPSAKTFSTRQFPTIKSASILSVLQKFPETKTTNETFARRGKEVGLNRVYEVKVSHSDGLEKVINELLADPNVEYAEPSYIHRINLIPNDPRYTSGEQSYLNIIRAPEAWNLVPNSSNVIIGIVDSGSETTHPDLAANIFDGWDLVGASSTNIVPDNNSNVISPANDHGVHVSGIASAVTNNNTGVASTAFNAKLLIVKAGPDDSGSDILRGYEGIKYAADRGAHIINCSWGSNAASSFGRDIIDYAISKGSLVIAAAGNTDTDTPEYPAAYRGVLAIANTTNGDEKATSSSYGEHVALSAPGNSILSTTFNKTYGLSSGTSMATPVVSSAAALVKSHFPLLNMQQVGELLRITADNIDSKNPEYIGRLGKGRLNVLRALTENPPSVRIQNIAQEEHRSTNVLVPDTLILYLDIKNFLFGVSNLKLTLSTSSPDVTVLTPEFTVASLATLEAKQIGPFKIAIRPETASNTSVSFQLNYAANTYQDFENFSVIVAKDFLDIHTNSISTTITSNGRVGFSTSSEENGLGFLYKGEQLLFEASLMIGNSATRVSNNTRSANNQSDEHFIKTVRAHELVNNSDSVKAESSFDDRGNPDRLNVRVNQQ